MLSEQYFEFAVYILEKSQMDVFIGNRFTNFALILVELGWFCLFLLFFALLVLHLMLDSCLYVHASHVGFLDALIFILEQHIRQFKLF